MRRTKWMLLGSFLMGILLIGIGAGVMFWEYSSMEYIGEKKIGLEKETVKKMEYKLTSGQKKKKIFLEQCTEYEYEIEKSDKIPVSVVRYEVTYNPDYVEPYLSYEDVDDSYDNGHLYGGVLGLNCVYANKKSDFIIFMEQKDQMLKDLRDRKVSSYRLQTIKKVKVKVNPKTAEYLY